MNWPPVVSVIGYSLARSGWSYSFSPQPWYSGMPGYPSSRRMDEFSSTLRDGVQKPLASYFLKCWGGKNMRYVSTNSS